MKLAITEVSIGYNAFLQSPKGKYRTPGKYADLKLHYNTRLRRLINLVHRKPAYVLPRLFQLVFVEYNNIGPLPLDVNNAKSKNSLMGIIKLELDGLPEEEQILPGKLHCSVWGQKSKTAP